MINLVSESDIEELIVRQQLRVTDCVSRSQYFSNPLFIRNFAKLLTLDSRAVEWVYQQGSDYDSIRVYSNLNRVNPYLSFTIKLYYPETIIQNNDVTIQINRRSISDIILYIQQQIDS